MSQIVQAPRTPPAGMRQVPAAAALALAVFLLRRREA
jgi:hypothetical protein